MRWIVLVISLIKRSICMSFGYRLGIIEKELKPKVERGNCSVMVVCVCVCVFACGST